jgi:hypothetical protein
MNKHDKRIQDNLARHNTRMEELIADGINRDAASMVAFCEITHKVGVPQQLSIRESNAITTAFPPYSKRLPTDSDDLCENDSLPLQGMRFTCTRNAHADNIHVGHGTHGAMAVWIGGVK